MSHRATLSRLEGTAQLAFGEPAPGEGLAINEYSGREDQFALLGQLSTILGIQGNRFNHEWEVRSEMFQDFLRLIAQHAVGFGEKCDAPHQPLTRAIPVPNWCNSVATGTYIV